MCNMPNEMIQFSSLAHNARRLADARSAHINLEMFTFTGWMRWRCVCVPHPSDYLLYTIYGLNIAGYGRRSVAFDS